MSRWPLAPIDAFMQYVEAGEPDQCWQWTGPVNPLRGDRPQWRGKNASRWAYILNVGEPGDGEHVEHECENRFCVNVHHLRAVSPAVNYERLKRTHCKWGHELTDDNRVDAGPTGHGDSRRYKCRLCSQQRERERTARRRRAREAAIG